MCELELSVEEIDRAIRVFADVFNTVRYLKDKIALTNYKQNKTKHTQNKTHTKYNKIKELETMYKDLLNQLYVSKDKQNTLIGKRVACFEMPKLVLGCMLPCFCA